MKPKAPKPTEPIHSSLLKEVLPKVEPLPLAKPKESILKAVPYYLLSYGDNICRLGAIFPNKKVGLILKGIGKLLEMLGRYYKVRG